ncbi:3-oxoacyl-[acyl-carrier-protein] synthase II (Beta-ketoacyl-ACP synthase II) (KAS II) [Candidatus Methylomirabilis oxygeniifera]|uniref:3-oxoacyl-[acyl-carrier-protein] synthase 2 n=1 Tax=Methylomirabilis oxygeniifera TaxID=671143 RepID=D5MFG2_METO1|nr:3-oxoacyl-[acyl-carrier-protein] synthase II (Beta-ketoacyl-ACP synthase II) (KAS II) [Candidatus Methylomirabilis oxyfera]
MTGLGVVAPNGIGVDTFWKSLMNGVSGIDHIARFDASRHDTKIAAEVKGFDPLLYMEKKEVKKMDRFIHYAMAGAIMAVDDAQLVVKDVERSRIGVLIGTGMGGIPCLEDTHKVLLEKGPGRISPFFIPSIITNLASGNIAIRFGLRGPNLCVSTACATGNHAIGDSFELIRRGMADAMFAGGTEAVISPLTIGGFGAMKALSTRNDAPQRASRPFDKGRDGFVMGEGAGVLILEELEHALHRSARIYAELSGYGMSADAYHMTAPEPEGAGAIASMNLALEDAGLQPEQVDYINAHGTSTPAGDAAETKAIKKVFGDHAYRLAVSSIKSMTGHLLGAAGGVEAVATALTLHHGVIPPTTNYDEPDPECDLDYVPNNARRAEVRVAFSNSFGFGGTNATLVFKRYE